MDRNTQFLADALFRHFEDTEQDRASRHSSNVEGENPDDEEPEEEADDDEEELS